MKTFITVIFIMLNLLGFSQKEYHVFPLDHQSTPGSEEGNGSLNLPWDLQTALNQSTSSVNGGDVIWIHQGIYNGRFVSTLQSSIDTEFVTVSAFKTDKVILNGNVDSSRTQVLEVRGKNVIYKNFEITCLGLFSRDMNETNFERIDGLGHMSGEDCQFINLIIHDNPGLGFGSWKQTGGTRIENCMIYSNGFMSKKGKGRGEGMYVQNTKDNERIIKGNIIFNNYYKGIEVWSAGRKAEFEYVKNITLDNNVIFNSGLPSEYRTVDNIIVGTDDRNGINIAKNITIKNNILYHNTDFQKNEINGDAASLTLGFYKKSPIENVIVDNNIIIGRNNALRILYAKSLSFSNNVMYSGYVNLNPTMYNYINEGWNFDNNLYYTKKATAFRLNKTTGYNFQNWKSTFNIDEHSQWKNNSSFNLNGVLDVSKFSHDLNLYRVVLFDKESKAVVVDFSKYYVQSGMRYVIRDVEDYTNVLNEGVLTDDLNVEFQMSSSLSIPFKTLSNFGVYTIEFIEINPKPKLQQSIFGRFFRWLGF